VRRRSAGGSGLGSSSSSGGGSGSGAITEDMVVVMGGGLGGQQAGLLTVTSGSYSLDSFCSWASSSGGMKSDMLAVALTVAVAER